MAWKYELSSPGSIPPFIFILQQTEFNRVAVDSRMDVFACGVENVGGYPPAQIKVVKLAGNTGQLLWSKSAGGFPALRSTNECNALLVDGQGDVFFGGFISQGFYYDELFVLVKLSGSDGQTLWAQQLGERGEYQSRLVAAALAPGGDVMAVGRIRGLEYGDSTALRFSGTQGSESWDAPPFQGNGFRDPRTLVVDSRGDVLIAGSLNISESYSKTLVSKLSGADGHVLWQYEIVRPARLTTALSVDGAGDVIVADTTSVLKLAGGTGDVMWIRPTPARGISVDFANNIVATVDDNELVKLLGSSGEEMWHRFSTSTGFVSSVTFDEKGDLFLTGGSAGSTGGFSVAKISGADGDLLWQRMFLDEAGGGGIAVAVDSSGDVIASGSLVDTFQNQYGDAQRNSKGVVVKLWGRTGADYPPSAPQILSVLFDAILSLHLPLPLESSLLKQVDSASSILADGDPSNDSGAAKPLRLLISHVAALKGRRIAPGAADDLVSLAERAIATLPAD